MCICQRPLRRPFEGRISELLDRHGRSAIRAKLVRHCSEVCVPVEETETLSIDLKYSTFKQDRSSLFRGLRSVAETETLSIARLFGNHFLEDAIMPDTRARLRSNRLKSEVERLPSSSGCAGKRHHAAGPYCSYRDLPGELYCSFCGHYAVYSHEPRLSHSYGSRL